MNLNKIGSLAMATLMVLASVTLLSIVPVSASDDFTLGIYGNANQDDTIDMRDVTKIARMICWLEDEVDLADAKYDGNINVLDIIQTELIILGREKELTLIDEVDRIVTVEKPVERMVVSYHATAGVIKAIGAEDKVVGVSSTIVSAELLFPELSQLPSIGSTWAPDVESILMLEPDLVLTITSGSKTETLAEQLEGTGISVIGAYCTSPLTYTETVEKLAYILDKRTEAEEYIDWYEGYTDLIKDRTEELTEEDKPRVFGTYKYNEEWKTYGNANQGANQMIKMAGGINIAGDLPGGWITVDPEWVLEENPSIIFVQSGWPPHTFGYDVDDISEAKAFREEFMSLPVFENMDAVENEEVYLLHGDSMVWRSWFIGQVYLAKWFHPELFEDLDPKAIHQEWLTEFLGIDYDLDEHGVFVYHPEKHPDGK
ncbi:MAG: ABC transporter, solute-binding protein [Candidatus Syntrophoarchaeum caldarius]|uniref:ABC transporter, solute-binding protein n=1 Tax=Candidatus Syntropharchaeum caldarium TaxID=1838285 RepID=A0A1F2PC97_9EURY|nr:MAG: ABC transporter, solute-binding protein [Candidatus Syntrophoarchaeum caldarius]